MSPKSFIETQFPVSKVSKESYKERKAVQSQTLTGLGKWWGRKPLVLVRAALLGMALPTTDEPERDYENFLSLMTMDEEGLWQRKTRRLSPQRIFECLSSAEQKAYGLKAAKDVQKLSGEKRGEAERTAFSRLTYDEKISLCCRPEQYEPDPESDTERRKWEKLNAFYHTQADNLSDFLAQLSEQRFGRRLTVGDCFAGGGSIPFEAARLGFSVFASDLNPVAGLLNWANLHLLSLPEEKLEKIQQFREEIYQALRKQIKDWGIERNEQGWQARYYLYCNEIVCPEEDCGCKIPLSSGWVTSARQQQTGVELVYNKAENRMDFQMRRNLTKKQLAEFAAAGTAKNNAVICPHCGKEIPMAAIRREGRGGLRLWEKEDYQPRQEDVFQERLYCICYEETYWDENDNLKTRWHFVTPDENDFLREKKAEALLKERFANWQEKGYLPNSTITAGEKTDEPIRVRGWQYWHQLFNVRQLLILGTLTELIEARAKTREELVVGLLGLNHCMDVLSKLARWDSSTDTSKQTFYNQALNTLYNYATRSTHMLMPAWLFQMEGVASQTNGQVNLADAKNITTIADIWLTDPPYADAVNYHELTEFFLAWDKTLLKKAFPDWYTDSKRVLAVRGKDETFNRAMVDIYKNLTAHMPDDGMQIIMFTHQDVAVWADLAMVVWSAGLQVTAAWNIITETDASGLKNGNYVKGTVLLVLRKQQGNSTAYLDELMPDIEDEVKRQIESMQALDDKEDPNFNDADYILAAYAAALKVLTSVSRIEDIDVEYELSHQRERGEVSEIAKIIEEAKKIAYDQLIPQGFDHFIWRMMEPAERFYIKGLEAEKNGIYQISTYQELARGFGVTDYRALLADTRANSARLRTGGEWKRRNLDDGFGATLLRHILMALYIATKDESGSPLEGKTYLRAEVSDYWNKRDRIQEILKFVAAFRELSNMSAWHDEAEAAKIIKELVANDGI